MKLGGRIVISIVFLCIVRILSLLLMIPHDSYFVQVTATVHHVKEINVQQNLLRLPISIHGKMFEAMVDTGSDINVMKYSIWHDWAKVPMDVTASMHLTDNNGGISQLHGLVPEMTFQIGIVDCKTSFWISDNCPPEILLGHPWQIKNKVTIVKKDNGMYLVLMDQKYDPKFSILLRPN